MTSNGGTPTPTPIPQPGPIPIPNGADPVPSNGTNPHNPAPIDIAPPPGIEDMPPLSAAAMSSFASAAKGVTTKAEVGETNNEGGLLVLSGAAS